ncbi:serine hydrolase domain-containing protein [Streptomyces sp. NPDC056983]|uniref:serine hydrolase domain-containing protein n=1 Tax=Streptomyces sp. NPDC056983 TaxID=3345987 RepID=UPI00362948DE
MPELEQLLDDAVAGRKMPFAVGAVATREGIAWEGGAGDAAPGLSAGPDTVMRVVSMTKAIGTAAVLMVIDNGLLDLETPVASVLPEFADLPVLEDIGPGGPVLRPQRTACTLRHLLTHTSGLAYEAFHAKQAAHAKLPGAPDILGGTKESLHFPLMFDPGTDFVYGMSTDWAGRMVEEVDGRRMDRILREELFDPMGMSSTTFELGSLKDRGADVLYRTDDGGFGPLDWTPPSNPDVYCVGHALYSTARDYLTFLRMLLRGGELDGRRYLSQSAITLMSESQTDIRPVFAPVQPEVSAPVDLFPAGTPQSWTAAFLRNDTDIPERRAAGSLCWAGFLNTHCWADPATGLAAVLMTQNLPFCDPGYMEAYIDFERAAYRRFAPSAGAGSGEGRSGRRPVGTT